MAKFFRKLSFVLAFAMLVGQFGSANVFAEEAEGKPAPQKKELSSIEITNVDEPVPGKPLDSSATVTSAEGESWEIPVIWVDESGKTATVAEAGKRYVPTFAMYVPSQYTIRGMDASGKFPIKLPAFLTALYGTDKILFIVDPASHLTYIFGGAGSVAGGSSVAPASNSEDKNGNKKDESSESDDDDDDDDDEEELSVLEKYCAQSAIDHFKNNDGFLEWLIDVIMNEIHPQAVDLLMKGFPAYAEAAEKGEISSKLGLYIYNVEGVIDGAPAPKEALAFVQGTYVEDNFRLVMGIETSLFKLVQDEDGKWILSEKDRNTLDNTVVHEMMHGFMFDYTRTGLTAATYGDYEHGFPFWFVEGSATAVDNAYQYWYDIFSLLKTDGKYDADSVRNTYMTKPDKAGNLLFDLNSCSPQDNPQYYQTSAYASGYLACLYLGYLDAKSRGEAVELEDGRYNIDVIRGGINHILSQLHGTGDGLDRKTLGSIIKQISGSAFKDTKDFQNKFIKNNVDSNKFAANYLQMMEDIKTSGDVAHANGSILLGNDGQNSVSPIKRGVEPGDPSVYKIIDKPGSAVSDVNDRRANLTGGNVLPGDGTHEYVNGTKAEEQAAAAKAEDAESADEQVPADDPAENDVPAADITPDTPAEPEDAGLEASEAEKATEAPVADIEPEVPADDTVPEAPAADTALEMPTVEMAPEAPVAEEASPDEDIALEANESSETSDTSEDSTDDAPAQE